MAICPEDVFTAYQIPGLIVDTDSVWLRFDQEFARIVSEKPISKAFLARDIGVSWGKLNSLSPRTFSPKWMTTDVLLRMNIAGFDINYVLFGKRSLLLEKDEAALLDNYRNASPNNKKVLSKIGAALEKQIDSDDAHIA